MERASEPCLWVWPVVRELVLPEGGGHGDHIRSGEYVPLGDSHDSARKIKCPHESQTCTAAYPFLTEQVFCAPSVRRG